MCSEPFLQAAPNMQSKIKAREGEIKRQTGNDSQ